MEQCLSISLIIDSIGLNMICNLNLMFPTQQGTRRNVATKPCLRLFTKLKYAGLNPLNSFRDYQTPLPPQNQTNQQAEPVGNETS